MPGQSENQITASLPERITADFRLKIASGAWAPGTALPTRRDLAKSYGVALRTIEQAMAPLINEGAVETRGVKGTFVSLEGDRRIDSSRIASLAFPSASRDISAPVSLGIIGIWSGIHGENMVESIGSRAIEHEAAAHAHVSLHYFNRYVGRDVPGISMVEAGESLLNEGVDGVIAMNPHDWNSPADSLTPFLERMDSYGVPVVLFSRVPSHVRARQVVYDDVYAGYEAARHLVTRDWKSLVYLAPFDKFWIADRLAGVREAVEALRRTSPVDLAVHPSPDSRLVFTSYGDYEIEGYRLGREALAAMTEPTGIIACNDMVGYGVLKAAAELGLQAGKDFAIIGFDDFVHSRRHGLSSVRPPLEQMGAECVDVLLKAVRGERCPLVVTLQSEVVSRSSTTRPREDRYATLGGIREKEMMS